ncbi:hypothetical protein [Algoriphagus chordae]|uniref:CHRD domain-containing protein n=1 Tax=Algoriphagus chordae TaxID=237019 RepID=A0A2W7SG03_9BACT|nr:hypothetical protein [Algoriphagus chordae]PZX49642.1 hypothetical protein LV85_03085 [Algoriphagus chordae]
MRKIFVYFIVLISVWSCNDTDPEVYTGQKLEYQLYKASEYDYTGEVTIRELTDGNLELSLQLVGAKTNSATSYPAHLHYGDYTDPEAPMALMLSPVNGSTLQSKTVLGPLMDGTMLSFEDIQTFDGHVKVHLASEGPDYKVILVTGNVGSNEDDNIAFDASKITSCSPDF